MKTNLIMRQVKKRTRTTNEELLGELSEKLEMLIWGSGEEFLKITEKNKCIKRTYLARGLSIEVEDGYVMIADYDDIIINNEYFSKVFLQEFISDIRLENSDENFVGEISFKDGRSIKIEKVEE